jgi:hypothetical protein
MGLRNNLRHSPPSLSAAFANHGYRRPHSL